MKCLVPLMFRSLRSDSDGSRSDSLRRISVKRSTVDCCDERSGNVDQIAPLLGLLRRRRWHRVGARRCLSFLLRRM